MTGVVGYTTGVYDMFHIGHLNVLRRARLACDHLVVGVTTDELSLAAKGKTPVVPFEERMDIVRAIRYVDDVVPQTSMDKLEAWEKIGFDAVFVGDDWKGTDKWNALEAEFAARGVTVRYFAYTQHTSSTLLRAALTRMTESGSAAG
ncbi:adenylyltransferase/cytidyltransferase family protein [Blastococcus haudaquaticus]|uniref:Choline-phosphate cytidylyltransferase/glycerol-3-phosphate cytidylyltransferase n=1 Tax=Blastococcus haudaquaticus TaxID=1938745 RepID=A0A286H174_9ACTN|nr:adenylyltransferase/cytidyltransferase family protein [Blastococcus haudaquaticus]SOE01054.1 choline-phosphate cytidylyltransferase/glycerol-3-phosphate cytidylyltransferase [Blastococcus haudaquaticus]